MSSSQTSDIQDQAETPQVPPEREAQRKMMHELELSGIKQLGPIPDSIEEFWTTIPLSDGWESKTKVMRPKQMSPGGKHPLIVLFHGGAFFVGTPDQVNRPARDFAEKFGAVVVCPSYKLAPENPWPTQMHNGLDILVYLSKNAESKFGANLDAPDGGFIVGGFSAGGTIAAVIAGISVFGDGKNPAPKLPKPLTGAFFGVTSFVVNEIVPEEYKSIFTSRVENANVEGLNAAGVQIALKALQCTDYHSPWFSPVNHFTGANSNLTAKHPPTYIQVGKYDPLRDDGIIYQKILASHEIPTRFDLFPDDGHVAWTAQPNLSKSTNPTIGEATMSGMEWLLQQNY
jgi:acetyl esterase/lipase